MAFSGLGSPEMFAALNNAEDVSPTISFLSPYETPFLDWLGDSGVVATWTKHEFMEEELRPNLLTTGSAINSATANTGITLTDFGDLLTVGTILENPNSTAPEIMRVASVVGPLSVLVSRAADGGAVGSLASGATLFVRGNYALEGDDHPSIDVTRPRRRKTTPVGLFHIPIAISGTQLAINALGGVGTGELSKQETNRVREFLRDLEKEVLHGTFVNSTQTLSTYRGIRGLRAEVTSINSTITAASFTANPHLYLGDVWEQAFAAGASENEEWGIVAGRGLFRDMSNMNDTKVQDSNEKESFKRLIRDYEGPFGKAQLILSRALQPRELYIVPRNRVKVFPIQGRSAQILNIAKTGDSEKRMLVGEYGVEIHHAYAMARLRA